jgi:anaerobic ribonucleoside-triphosphate reductase
MHVYEGRGYNQTVTPDHRVLYKEFNIDKFSIKHSDEIFNSKTAYSLPVKFKGSMISDGAGLSDAEVRLAAMIYTDGSFDVRNNDSIHKITIYKSPNRNGNEDIVDAANDAGLTFSSLHTIGSFGTPINKYVFYGDSARRLYDLVGRSRKAIDKKFLELDSRQSEMFIEQWSDFDGKSHDDKFALQYDTDEVKDAIQHIAIRAGKTSYLEGRKKVRYVKIRKVDTIQPKHRHEIDYNGIVWCPNVQDGTAIFRKNGSVFISGQCQAPFTNITLDWVVPNDLKNLKAIVGGKETDFTYGDCKKEMDMINKAFLEIFLEGDANGRGFQYPIPTYSITKDFDWSETENNKLLFDLTAKYGTPYFSNYINSSMNPSDVRSMCCRLRLDLRELRKRNGGFFGSGESTGSIGVVTINMPRIGYLASSKEDFYKRLDHIMDVCARSLQVKRKFVTELYNKGLYPYSKRYLGDTGFNNHFSTIGLVGMNEACLNAKWLKCDLSHKEAQEFTE